MACEPSVLPLSATITSPAILYSHNACCALTMHVARVSASFRHGITIDTSRAQEAVAVGCSICYSTSIIVSTTLYPVVEGVVVLVRHYAISKVARQEPSVTDRRWRAFIKPPTLRVA